MSDVELDIGLGLLDHQLVDRNGRNGRLSNVLGIVYFFLILVIAVSAIPLMILSNGGQG